MKHVFNGFLITSLILLTGCLGTRRLESELLHERNIASDHYLKQIRYSGESDFDLEKLPSDLSNEQIAFEKPEHYIRGDLNLENSIRLALGLNPQLRTILLSTDIAHGRIYEALAEALPDIALNGNYTRLNDVSKLEFGDISVDFGQLDNYSLTLSANQTLWHGGATAAAIRGAHYFSFLTQSNIESAIQDVIFRIIHSYNENLLLQKQLDVVEKYIRLSQVHLDDVKIKRQYGTATDFNVLRAEVEFSNYNVQRIQLNNELKKAKANLLKTMGVSQFSQIEFVDTLEYLPEDVTIEKGIQLALDNRPDLATAQLEVKLQNESVNYQRSQYFPDFDLFFNYDYANPNPSNGIEDDWGDAWQAGITAHLSIFDGMRTRGQMIQEKAKLKQAKMNLLNRRENALFEVQTSILSMEDAQEAVESQKLVLEQANEAMRLAEVGYREGTLDQVDILEARTALSQAQLQYYRSIYSHTLAKLQYRKSTGTLLNLISDDDTTFIEEK